MMAEHSKIYRIDICSYLSDDEPNRGAHCYVLFARDAPQRSARPLSLYYSVSSSSLTRAYNALRALAGRQEQK